MKNEIVSLTSLRFIAAFYVFIFHCRFHFGNLNEDYQWLNNFIQKGQVGMTLFFLLSGYILTFVYQDIPIEALKKYYISRIARIYPTYIISGVITFPFYLSTFDNITWDIVVQIILALIAFLFMIQAWFPPLFSIWNFGGSWSLSVEAFFYMIFPIIRIIANQLSTKKLIIILCMCYLWATVPILYINVFTNEGYYWSMNIYSYTSPIFRLGEFIIGVIVFIISRERGVVIFNNWRLMLTFMLILCIFLITPSIALGLSVYSFICIPAFIWLISFLGNGGRILLLDHKLLIGLGRISYSFYLTQFFVFFIINEMNITVEFKWLLSFFGTLGISIGLYFLIEKPCRLYVHNLLIIKDQNIIQ